MDDLLLRLCCTRDEEKKTGGSMNVEEEKKKKKKKESVLEMYVKKHGVTLDQLHCIAYCEATAISSPSIDHNNRKNVKVSIHRDMNETEVRHLLIDSVSSASLREEEDGATTIVIASYDRRVLGQSGSGHFSPVGAYDAVTDAVLVLDTAMFKYEAHWVPVSMLVEATKKVDESCGRTRGFLRVSVDGEEMKKKKTMMSSSSSSRSRVGGGGGRCEMCKDMLMMADSSNKNKTQERGVGQRLACCC